MKLKRLTALLLSVMMVLSLAACGGGGDTKDDSASGDLSGKTIIIGNITPVTGAQAAYGLAITNSIQLAIDEINAAGGILGATVKLRNFVTDNGCHILDASGLRIEDPKALEAEINAWPGVVTVGLFAARGADVLLLGTQEGVQTFERG